MYSSCRLSDVAVCCCEGIDHLLAQHIAHLFIRDPVSVFSEKVDLDDAVDTDHFEVLDHCRITLLHFNLLDNVMPSVL